MKGVWWPFWENQATGCDSCFTQLAAEARHLCSVPVVIRRSAIKIANLPQSASFMQLIYVLIGPERHRKATVFWVFFRSELQRQEASRGNKKKSSSVLCCASIADLLLFYISCIKSKYFYP